MGTKFGTIWIVGEPIELESWNLDFKALWGYWFGLSWKFLKFVLNGTKFGTIWILSEPIELESCNLESGSLLRFKIEICREH